MTLHWRPTAIEDRVAIYDFVEKDSPDAAILVDDRILRAIERLKFYPGLGHSGRRKGTKQFVIRRTPLIIAYVVKGDTV